MEAASAPAIPSSTLNWKNLITSQAPPTAPFNLSFIPSSSETVSFTEEEITKGSKQWCNALVGYALGRRPLYDNLLQAIKKVWTLRGNVDLISLNDGFFLFKFNCAEDYDMVLSGGPWFILGKPFIFKKWTPDFTPVREDFKEIPIWVKFPNLPLCYWSENGISKIARKIGTPLSVDPLTAKRARLTFARLVWLLLIELFIYTYGFSGKISLSYCSGYASIGIYFLIFFWSYDESSLLWLNRLPMNSYWFLFLDGCYLLWNFYLLVFGCSGWSLLWLNRYHVSDASDHCIPIFLVSCGLLNVIYNSGGIGGNLSVDHWLPWTVPNLHSISGWTF